MPRPSPPVFFTRFDEFGAGEAGAVKDDAADRHDAPGSGHGAGA